MYVCTAWPKKCQWNFNPKISFYRPLLWLKSYISKTNFETPSMMSKEIYNVNSKRILILESFGANVKIKNNTL